MNNEARKVLGDLLAVTNRLRSALRAAHAAEGAYSSEICGPITRAESLLSAQPSGEAWYPSVDACCAIITPGRLGARISTDSIIRTAIDLYREHTADLVRERDGIDSVPGLHPLSDDLMNRFAVACKEKLAVAQVRYGFGAEWADAGWMDECRQQLRIHVEKGDPRDVANYCAFLWHHGEKTK